jgi:hypothetical protein
VPRFLVPAKKYGFRPAFTQAFNRTQVSFCVAAPWRRFGGKSDGSNFDAPASAKVDAVVEGEFDAEPAA